uniref:GPI inositol-deacylase n=1 Tax=Meloidogyne incognita TaxID=6306 RepID=A0A914LP98_MELIC
MGRILSYFCIPLRSIFLYILVQFFFKSDDINRCDMTFMWRRMQYMKINVEHERYSLFLYGEGIYAENFRQTNFLNGLPILFVPGNAGSGRQVRSLGSLLQNKTEGRMTNFHFDVFAVDFNEELTAYNFDCIISQANFLVKAVNSIHLLYKQKPVQKIVIIGHSMGGIVIQYAMMLEDFIVERVAFIIGFAVPYSEPPFYFDKRFLSFYHQLNNNKSLNLPKIISINGGIKDEFIDEDWTNAPFLALHSSTNSLDRVGLDMDHKCILWCNQLVRHTSRILFDYASNPRLFIENFNEYLYKHYHLSKNDFDSQLIKEDDYTRVNITNVEFNDHFLFILSKNQKQSLLAINGCEYNNLINNRYLSTKYLFSLAQIGNCSNNAFLKINLKTKFWFLNQNIVKQTPINLNLFKILFNWPKIKIFKNMDDEISLLQIPLNFTFSEADFFIYNVEIVMNKCKTVNKPSNTFLLVNNQIRRINSITKQNNKSSLTSSIFIYTSKDDQDKNFQLLSINTNKCEEYLISFSFDFKLSLIRGFRRIRHFLPISFILILTFCCLFVCSDYLAGFVILLLAVISKENIDSISAVLLLLSNLFLLSISYIICVNILRPILNITTKIFKTNFNLFKKAKYFVSASFLIFFFYSHNSSLIFSTFYSFGNLMTLNNYSNNLIFSSVATLQVLFSFFQIPSVVDYIWKFIKYGEWRAETFDPNFEANCLFAVFIFILQEENLIFQKLLNKNFSERNLKILTNLILLFFFLLIYIRNPNYCFITWDDLTLFIILILIYLKKNIKI